MICKSHVEMILGLCAQQGGFMHSPVNLMLLNRHGLGWESRKAPETGTMTQGECFKNALELALEEPDFYTYCEGFALKPGLIPLDHAWVVGLDGKVVDPTWRWEPGIDYYGVAFNSEWAVSRVLEQEVYGILGNLYRWKHTSAMADLLEGLDPMYHQLQSVAEEVQ